MIRLFGVAVSLPSKPLYRDLLPLTQLLFFTQLLLMYIVAPFSIITSFNLPNATSTDWGSLLWEPLYNTKSYLHINLFSVHVASCHKGQCALYKGKCDPVLLWQHLENIVLVFIFSLTCWHDGGWYDKGHLCLPPLLQLQKKLGACLYRRVTEVPWSRFRPQTFTMRD